MDLLTHRFEHVLQKLPGGHPICLLDELGDCKLTGPVNAHEEVELAFSSLSLANVDMKKPMG